MHTVSMVCLCSIEVVLNNQVHEKSIFSYIIKFDEAQHEDTAMAWIRMIAGAGLHVDDRLHMYMHVEYWA